MPHYHIWTIGCQMNKADSESMAVLLEHHGYRSTAKIDDADIVVLNSCVVRQSAESKVANKIDALRRLDSDKVLAVTGCIVDENVDGLRKRFPRVDLFFEPQDIGKLSEYLNDRGAVGAGSAVPSLPAKAKISTLINIMHGCDNFCSYCIVPYRRGREVSRPMADIVAEVESVVALGAKEVVLLGQNVDSYGHGLAQSPTLADLLGELNRIDGLARIRFLTSHPKDMSDRLIAAVAGLDKVCECISLPFQAGDDDILKAMHRGYTSDDYRRLVERIRSSVPDVALSTDVIVGFPGESEEQYRRSREIIEEIRFDTVHIACYSPRSGTIASRELADDVSASEKVRRRKELEAIQERIVSEINSGLKGRIVEVLVEGRKKGKWWGRARTDKLVFFEDAGNHLGQVVNVCIESTSSWSLQGRIDG
ncbi:MAG: tRNA (N6-isopentenyl adenosine(37)-C2)-methylthiotransferase MiaB [Dehalococcoidia bacterium]|jgi:tRNA-2-methylthio-N6-dimethylallyladenosine synthase